MSSAVTLVDYGVGNVLSARRALEASGAVVEQTGDPERVARAVRLVLPGVGAFGACVERLQSRGLFDAVRTVLSGGRPFLGICVGMQMLLERSEEFGSHEGFGVIPGAVKAVPATGAGGAPHKVPHIGWSALAPAADGSSWSGTILAGLDAGTPVYFVHSFTAWPERNDDRIADADYDGCRIAAVIGRPPVYGCQFHPEKSGPAGLAILRRFLAA